MKTSQTNIFLSRNYPLYSRGIGQRRDDGSLLFFTEVSPQGEILDGFSVSCSVFLTYEELDRVFRLKKFAKFAAHGAD